MEPVLIAGAGPVGLMTALLLARWQVPTVVLEAAPERTAAGSRAICFQRDVLDVFDRVGCADAMVSEGVTWTTGRTFYREHELFTVTFPDPGKTPLPPWINLSQDSAERLLHAKAAAQPLIDLRFDHKVVGIARDEDGVVVTAQAGQRRTDVHGSHLVGADGPRGSVRQLLGIGFPGESYEDQFLICDVQAELPFPNERRFFFDPSWNPGRQVLVHQCPGGVWRIDWQVPDGFDLGAERDSGGLDARVRQITGSVPYEIVWATAYRFHERVATSFGAGREFLAGDAAHLYSPFGARGLNSGAQDAENLAWKLAFVKRGWSPPGLLDSYHAERAAAAAENLKVTTTTMEFLVPQTRERRRWRTEVLDRAVADQAARKLIDSGKLAEPFWYTTSPLTTPGPSLAGFPVTPGAARPPVPGVLCPDGPVNVTGKQTRLRRLFGDGFVILTQRTAEATAATELAAGAISAPARCLPLADIDVTGVARQSLDATEDSVHIIRPDGHLAAVLPRFDPAGITAALRRATGIDRPVSLLRQTASNATRHAHRCVTIAPRPRIGRRAELGCLTRTTKEIMSGITQSQLAQSDPIATRTIYNFSAGPSVLPAPVLRKAQEELIDWRGTGMSVMEMSHRSKEFISIAEDAESRLRALMRIPDSYKVLFLQGGATGQFVAVPDNLSTASGVADYVVTGQWGQKACAEASKHLEHLNVAARTDPHTYVPPLSEWRLSRDAAYVHITLNETVNGVVFDEVPDTGDVPLVADVSSIILSEPIDVTKFGALYAGAQKNIGPAGLAVVIVREDLLARGGPRTPQIWDWRAMAKAGSMLNTPPTYAWYIAGLVFAWLQDEGGVPAIGEVNRRKADKLYAAINDSNLFANPVAPANRSRMNVPFTVATPELEREFLAQVKESGLGSLEGHRSVGGVRASLYNAMPEAGVDALVAAMKEFENAHG